MSLEVTVRLAALAFKASAFVVLSDTPDSPIRAAHGVPEDARRRYRALFGTMEPLDAPFFVEDAASPGALQAHPWLEGVPELQFVAGAPLRQEGAPVGMLYVVDAAPHTVDAADRAMLTKLARVAAEDLLTVPDSAPSAAPAQHENEAWTRRLSMVASRTTNGVVITDKKGRIEWVNEGFTRICGYTLDEVRGEKPGHVLQGPESDPETVAYMRRKIEAHEGFTAELVNYTKSGKRYWVHIDADPLYDETGAHTGFMGIETDITERKAYEAAIREKREQLEMALDAADMGIWEWDIEGDELTFSEHGQRLFGEDFAKVTSEQFLDRLHPEDRAELVPSVQETLAQRGALNATYRITRPGGGVRWINSRGRVQTNEAGEPVRMIGTVADVTKRAQTEARNRAMLQAIPDLIFRFDAEGTYLDVDAEQEAQLAAPAEDLVGKTVDDVLPPDLAATWKQHIRTALDTSELQHLEYTLTTQDGTERTFEGRIVAIGNQEAQAIIRDITERKQRQQELIEAKQHAEEMNRLKTAFLANMSHELRTPLTSILGFSEILAEEIEDNGSSELAHLIARSGRRLMETLNSVLDLAQLESRSVTLDLDRIDLVQEVREAVRMLSPHKKTNGVNLRVEVPDGPVWAMGESGALSRVLNNLLSNALKFTSEGHVAVVIQATETHAELQVEDTGIGIDASFLPHLFDEFRQESTGAGREYEGVGLGLTITKRLVEQMDGTIQVASEKGQGTTFTVRLPKPEDAD